MSNVNWKSVFKWLSATGLVLCILLTLWSWRAGLLTSQQTMYDFVSRAGIAGVLLFILFQVIQVVIPILPGGLGCLAGVLMFGAFKGFLCNYIGICIGSMLAFAIARNLGRPLLPKLFSEKTIQKYEHWTDADSPFPKLFGMAIFLPVAPDDFLCYLAGTTTMRWKEFTAIIWLCKPFAIALYSMGLMEIWERTLALVL